MLSWRRPRTVTWTELLPVTVSCETVLPPAWNLTGTFPERNWSGNGPESAWSRATEARRVEYELFRCQVKIVLQLVPVKENPDVHFFPLMVVIGEVGVAGRYEPPGHLAVMVGLPIDCKV